MDKAEKFRIGIMGCKRGGPFVGIFRTIAGVEVPAVCENDPETVEKIQKKYPDVKVYSDFDEFIDSGLDAVFLANYFDEHAKYAILAMKKGIHVLSETTAAPTLGECVDLVEAAEETGAKYMLAANMLYIPSLHAMKAEIESGKHGKIFYAEGEYNHGADGGGAPAIETLEQLQNPTEEAPAKEIDLDNLHWRQTLPSCYYNMHSLGPLMYITSSVPKKVTCTPMYQPEYSTKRGKVSDCPGSIVITKMDNGAVYKTSGCNAFAPTGKWFRIGCEKTTFETGRYHLFEQDLTIISDPGTYKKQWQYFHCSGVVSPEEYDRAAVEGSGHGGTDYFICYKFVKYLKSEETPFLDVYNSAALSATGILAWYSALSDGKEYEVPDFHIKEERDKVRGDYRTPFAKKFSDITLPCRLADKDKFTGLLR